MSQIILEVDNRYLHSFLNFLNKLRYIKIAKVKETSTTKSDETERLAVLNSLSGAWPDDRDADNIIEDIYSSRVFTREIEAL